mmetsp:Transcript_85078/g.264584  ORF Transcript_85078/g.264584 Transcript_85078/m.264584 type:complete len:228 (+) Transcript_85078:339-1022(+)
MSGRASWPVLVLMLPGTARKARSCGRSWPSHVVSLQSSVTHPAIFCRRLRSLRLHARSSATHNGGGIPCRASSTRDAAARPCSRGSSANFRQSWPQSASRGTAARALASAKREEQTPGCIATVSSSLQAAALRHLLAASPPGREAGGARLRRRSPRIRWRQAAQQALCLYSCRLGLPLACTGHSQLVSSPRAGVAVRRLAQTRPAVWKPRASRRHLGQHCALGNWAR